MSGRREAFAFLAALIVYCAFALHYWNATGPWVVDDTFIFLRYAENFARGLGLVFNPGERVEGYTSFLWVLLLSAATRLGLPPLGFAQAAGLILGGVQLFAAWRFARLLAPGGVAWLVPAWLATNRTFTIWSVQGMEVKLFGALVACSLWLWTRALAPERAPGLALGALVGLAALARPEGFLQKFLSLGSSPKSPP